MDKSKVKTVTQIKSNQPCENKRQALSQIKRIDWRSLEFRTPNQKGFYHTISRNDVTFSGGPTLSNLSLERSYCLSILVAVLRGSTPGLTS